MYLKVSANPEMSSVRRRLRPARSRRAMVTPSLRRPAGCGEDARGQHQPEERERKEHLPAQPHQLVVAEARKGRAHPKEAEEAEGDLQEKPDRPRDPGEGRDPEGRE